MTSLRLSRDNAHVLDVWDCGKGVLCRVQMQPHEQVTSFVQARLIDKNCLFVCVKSREGLPGVQAMHELRGFEIARDGQTCDFWIRVNLAN